MVCGIVTTSIGQDGVMRTKVDNHGFGDKVIYDIPENHYCYREYGVREVSALQCNGDGYLYKLKGDVFGNRKFEFSTNPSHKVSPLRQLMDFFKLLKNNRQTELTKELKEIVEIGKHIV